MAPTACQPSSSRLNRQSLLERILAARPDARPEDIRRIAPLFQSMPDRLLDDLITRTKKRIAQRKIQRQR